MLSKDGFDKWSKEYDNDVRDSYLNKEYPFDGYFDVFDIILSQVKSGAKVLDVGFGTGILTKKMYDLECDIYGIDFSEEMVLISKEKMPNATFYQLDFNDDLPLKLKEEKFDYIISTYAFHHLTDDKKVSFIQELSNMLNDNGKIIIGDIAFRTSDEQEECKTNAGDGWDSDEIYMIASDIIPRLEALNFHVKYNQVSSCSGLLEVEKNG